jgi:hypothetical protein
MLYELLAWTLCGVCLRISPQYKATTEIEQMLYINIVVFVVQNCPCIHRQTYVRILFIITIYY